VWRIRSIWISRNVCFFFFQAEDGIRDYKVTGVQTCALPISLGGHLRRDGRDEDRALEDVEDEPDLDEAARPESVVRIRERGADRSEERRVGKECRSRWWPDH